MHGASSCRRGAGWPVAVVALIHVVGAVAVPTAHGPAKRISFDIPSGKAFDTLHQFSRQAMVQTLYDFDSVGNRVTHAVRGLMEPGDALARMLADTGLVFEFVNERAVAIRLANPPGRVIARREHPGSEGPGSGAARSSQRATAQPGPERVRDLAEVQILASPFSFGLPVGQQVLSFDRVAIERTGVATLADFLRTLPQNFEGGPTQDTVIAGGVGNSGFGTGLNLRGLGSDATLVLINGRRIAPSGNEASFADISNIPLSAIDHIEILPDAASTLYGADAIGGVVNLVLRQSYSGGETSARIGGAAHSSLREEQFSQLFGLNGDAGHGILSFELYERDALPAAVRRQATSDLRPFGGDRFDSPFGNPGTIVIGDQVWGIPKGQDGTALGPENLIPGVTNWQDRLEQADVMPAQRRWSAYGTWSHIVRDNLRVFIDALYSQRTARFFAGGFGMALTVPSTNPFYVNPTGGTEPIVVWYNFLHDLGPRYQRVDVTTANLALGADLDLDRDWRLSMYGGRTLERQHLQPKGQVNMAALARALADPDPATAFNPFGDGFHNNPATLAAISDESVFFRSDSEYDFFNVTASGPVYRTAAGPVLLTVGLEHRDQSFVDISQDANFARAPLDLRRHATAAFGELSVPLTGQLELSLGARFEDYAGVGSGTTPRLGFHWEPLSGWAVRGSWSESLKPPNLPDLAETRNASQIFRLPDPLSQTGTTDALVWFGGNTDLRPEQARAWTLGTDLAFRSLAGLAFSLTYFEIEVEDKIQEFQRSLNVLMDPTLMELVDRTPQPEERADVCARSTFFSGALEDCLHSPIGAIVDLRLQNLAALKTRGVDIIGRYECQGAWGELTLEAIGTYLIEYSQASSRNAPLVNLANTSRHPLSRRLRGIASWRSHRGIGLTAVLHYAGSYRDTESEPDRRVASWTTWNLQLSYDRGEQHGGWLDGLRIALTAQNVFDEDPPFLNNPVGIGYDLENADLLGRVVSLNVYKKW